MKLIPSGTFRMGASPSQGIPGVETKVSAFRIGVTPVSWAIWKEYCEATSSLLPDDPGWGYPDDHPAVNVSWMDIMKSGGFCEWASNLAGYDVSLPTEPEWEYAARGGKDGFDYPWGNKFELSKLWCSETRGDGDPGTTASINRKDRIFSNGYGLTDMVGNVCQWCCEKHVSNLTRHYRVARGGSLYSFFNPESFRCASRDRNYVDDCNDISGFRLCSK